jgi:hypothetical protein
VNDIWEKVAACEKFSAALCFTLACCRESYIDPTSEEIECIPFRFAVAQEDEVHGVRIT